MEAVLSPTRGHSSVVRTLAQLPPSRRELSRPRSDCRYVLAFGVTLRMRARLQPSFGTPLSHCACQGFSFFVFSLGDTRLLTICFSPVQVKSLATPSDEPGNSQAKIRFEASSHYGPSTACRCFFCAGYGLEMATMVKSRPLSSFGRSESSCSSSASSSRTGPCMS